MKDHEIRELVNAVTKAVRPLTKHQCLRDTVLRAVKDYLKSVPIAPVIQPGGISRD